jgi:hypothetical protein
MLSLDPDTISLPSSEKTTELTSLEWPSNVCYSAPVVVSQSRTVLSLELDTITSLLSNEKATKLAVLK